MQVVTAKTRLSRISLVFCLALGTFVSAGTVRGQGLTLVSTALTDTLEAPIAGLFVYNDLVFVGGLSQGYKSFDDLGVRILDLSDPEDPTLIGRIPIRTINGESPGYAVVTDIESETFTGTIAVVLNGVPNSYSAEDWPEPYGVWDVSDPADPQFLSIFGAGRFKHVSFGEAGATPKNLMAIVGNLFYYVYQSDPRIDEQYPREKISHRLGIVDLSDPYNPVQISSWQETSDSALLGMSTNASGTRVYLCGVWPKPFGLDATHVQFHIIDTSDPANPAKIGGWEMPKRDPDEVSSAFIVRPALNDSIAILADGSWGDAAQGKNGILHFLDISDPADITKISEYDAYGEDSPGWTMALNVSVRNDIVYSAWARQGVEAIDISDVEHPTQTGLFATDRAWADAYPFGDTYVLAARLGREGVYVLRDESVVGRGTSVEEDREVPSRMTLDQNYPNPFHGSAEISFEIPETSDVRLSVFDLLGREVATVLDGRQTAGRHKVRLDLGAMPGGVYLYRLETEAGSLTRRAILSP